MNLITPSEPSARVQDGTRERAITVSRGTVCAALDVAAASCRGKRHAINEDSHSALDARRPIFVVADGVGGGAMASRASRELVRHVHDALDRSAIDDSAVREALLDADRAVGRSIAAQTADLGAATVALCAAIGESVSHWVIGWVGDCRVYRLGGGDAELLTRDDSYRELRETPPPGSALDDPARMVGNGAVNDPNVRRVELGRGEMLVLCSDGMHKHVDGCDIARLLRSGAAPLPRRCARLLSLARARGSVDDATVLVVHRAPSRRSPRSWIFGATAILGLAAAMLAASLPRPPGIDALAIRLASIAAPALDALGVVDSDESLLEPTQDAR
jgi:protein phosphatase